MNTSKLEEIMMPELEIGFVEIARTLTLHIVRFAIDAD